MISWDEGSMAQANWELPLPSPGACNPVPTFLVLFPLWPEVWERVNSSSEVTIPQHCEKFIQIQLLIPALSTDKQERQELRILGKRNTVFSAPQHAEILVLS